MLGRAEAPLLYSLDIVKPPALPLDIRCPTSIDVDKKRQPSSYIIGTSLEWKLDERRLYLDYGERLLRETGQEVPSI